MLMRDLMAARREGRGVHVTEWRVSAAEAVADGAGPLVDAITDWCRYTIGGTRRPYGIDRFELALACSLGEDTTLRTACFRDLRPLTLYVEGGLPDELATFLSDVAARPAPAGPEQLHVAAAIFSWGDAAHAVLPAAS